MNHSMMTKFSKNPVIDYGVITWNNRKYMTAHTLNIIYKNSYDYPEVSSFLKLIH